MPDPDELPSVPDADVDVTLDVTAHRATRLAALRAHATQVALWEAPSAAGDPAAKNSTAGNSRAAFAMSNGVAQPLLDVEEFTLLAGEPTDGTDDLFAGVA
jgi:N-acetyl-1-D-myo-inositol-2-amino-2-deoxy-alpha-D-glucopyranoside deacetylase